MGADKDAQPADVGGAADEGALELTQRDLELSSRRRLCGRVADAPYDFELVPAARGSARGGEAPLEGSVAVRVTERSEWKAMLAEILQLCNEAAWRRQRKERDAERAAKRAREQIWRAAVEEQEAIVVAGTQKSDTGDDVYTQDALDAKLRLKDLEDEKRQADAEDSDRKRSAGGQEAKPLLLEFILDRIDTDDPMFGYAVRTRAQGWLQGFVTVTTFTTWQPWFRWDSACALSGITRDDWRHRKCDASGVLAAELEQTPRFGDPDEEGVIWRKVAEISLLGGLGCGRAVLQATLDELAAESEYEYVCLQATDSSVPFYESMGFRRCGGMACYRPVAEIEARKETAGEDVVHIPGVAVRAHPSTAKPTIKPPARLKVVRESSGAIWAPRMYWLHKSLRDCLKQLRALDEHGVFQSPVDTDELWDYAKRIKRPLAFLDMLAFVQTGRYESFGQFEADFATICKNAMEYNPEDSVYHQSAALMLEQGKAILARWQRALPQFVRRGTREDDSDNTTGTPPDQDEPAHSGVKAPIMDHPAYVAEAYRDPDVLGYCHWTFPDQLVEDQFPSIMMVMRLAKPSDEQLAAESGVASRDACVASAPGDGVVPRGRRFAAKHSTAEGHNYYLGIYEDADDAAAAVRDSRVEHADELAEDDHMFGSAGGGKEQQQQQQDSDQQARQQAADETLASAAATPGTSKRKTTRSGSRKKTPAKGTAQVTPALAALRKRLVRAARPAMALRGADGLDADGKVRQDVLDELTAKHVKAHPEPVACKPNEVAAATARMAERDNEGITHSSPAAKLAVRGQNGRLVRGKRATNLYNKVVEVEGLPPCYAHKYYFVYHYIPDMQWVHLLPVHDVGVFTDREARTAKERLGRPRWQVVPEGQAREIDVSAARCSVVRAVQCVRSHSADEEVWDIVRPEEEEAYMEAQAQRKRERAGGRARAADANGRGGKRQRREDMPQQQLCGLVPVSKVMALTGVHAAQYATKADIIAAGEGGGAAGEPRRRGPGRPRKPRFETMTPMEQVAAAATIGKEKLAAEKPQRKKDLRERMLAMARASAAFEAVLSAFGVAD